MGGFKSGAADDDWGDAESADETGSGPDPTPSTEETEPAADADRDGGSGRASRRGETGGRAGAAGTSGSPRSVGETGASASRRDLPWTLTRNSITDGRDQTVQLHLQQSTVEAQREAARTLEAELGETVKKADLREAALLAGLDRVDEVAATLREWGYDLD
jgi:hypothetical protein